MNEPKRRRRAQADAARQTDEQAAEPQQGGSERQWAEEALRQYADRLQVLRSIDQAILEARMPNEIAQATLDRMRELIPCQRTSVVLFDYQTNELTVLAASPGDGFGMEAGTRLPLDEFRSLESLRQGEVQVTATDSASPDLSPVARRLFDKGLRFFVFVPLISRGELVGCLNMAAADREAVLPEHVDIARELADQLAVAIQNAHLLETERRRTAELEALRQASLHVTSSLELQPVLEAITEHALQLVSADNTHIFLYDGEELTFGTAMWAGGPQREPYAEPRPHGVTYTVARGGEKIVIRNVDVHPLFRDRKWGGAVASFPLRAGNEIGGVMNVAFEQPHTFTASELNVLELLADQAAIAVHNARLHQQLRTRADELAAALERQEELDRLKLELIQNVSHELRSPLGLILAYAELLDSGELGNLPPEQTKPISVIHRRAEMLSELVEDITMILEAESRPLMKGTVALHEVARTAVEDFRVAADQRGLELKAEIAQALPTVACYQLYMRRVLDNLLTNAIKFTPEGGTITVRTWQKDDQYVALEVRDTGIGIPPDHIGRVFERFYQVDGSSRRRYGGIGLGLALVKEITERHGGEVAVESKIGEGSVFTVTFPIWKDLEEPPEGTPPGAS